MEKLTKKDFKTLYKKVIKRHGKKVEKKRKKLLHLYAIVVSSGVLIFLSVVFLLLSKYKSPHLSVIFFFFLIILVVIGKLIVLFPHRKFNELYKTKIIKPIIETAFPGFKYSQTSSYSKKEFNSSSLFKKEANVFNSEDEITGKIKETNFKMIEVLAKYISRSSDGKSSNTKIIFKGFIFRFDFNKLFSTHTIVRPDIAEKFLGSFLGNVVQSKSSFQFDLIKLEDPLFEKKFVVYGKDQQEARYILSPSLMERILKLEKRLKGKVSFAFYDNQMILAVNKNKNHFEPNLFGDLAPFKEFREIYLILKEISKIVKVLDLNTRIWLK